MRSLVRLNLTTSGDLHVSDDCAGLNQPAVLLVPRLLCWETAMLSDCSCLLQGFGQTGSDEPGLLSSVCCNTLRRDPCSTHAAGVAASQPHAHFSTPGLAKKITALTLPSVEHLTLLQPQQWPSLCVVWITTTTGTFRSACLQQVRTDCAVLADLISSSLTGAMMDDKRLLLIMPAIQHVGSHGLAPRQIYLPAMSHASNAM